LLRWHLRNTGKQGEIVFKCNLPEESGIEHSMALEKRDGGDE
jgi:hypothetical protein